MLMPERQRLGREDDLDEPRDEQLLDDLLEDRQHARRGGRRRRARGPRGTRRSRARRGPRRGSSAARRSTIARIRGAVAPGSVSRTPGVQALPHRGVAAGAAEDEDDHRQQTGGVERVDDVRTRRGGRRSGCAAGGRRAAARRSPLDPARTVASSAASRVRCGLTAGRSSLAASPGGTTNRSYSDAADEHGLPQRHRTVLLDDDRGVTAHGLQPLAELLGVADRGRQRDQPDRCPAGGG